MSGAPYFFFELILSRSIFSSVSWYLLDSLLCILFFREKPPPHGPFCPELQTGSSTPKGIPTGRGERLQAGRMEMEIATGINRFQIRYFLYQLFFYGDFHARKQNCCWKIVDSEIAFLFFELPASQSINRSLEWVHFLARQNGNR